MSKVVEFIQNEKNRILLAKNLDKAFTKALFIFERETKRAAPVDTGRFRGSVQGRKTGFAQGQISSNVEYAYFLEFGTSRMTPRAPFRKGIVAAEQKAIDIIVATLKT